MTASGSEPHESFEPQPLDYPADAGLPPPVYPPTHPGYYQSNYQPSYQPSYRHHPAYPPVKPPGTNGKAIGALVTSLAGMICCGLPSIVGLVLGLVAMRETKRRGQDGYGIAVAAVVISTLVIIGYFLYVLLAAVMYASN